MIQKREIREKLEELLSDELDLEAFEDWLVQRSWNMHLDSSAAAQDLVSAIELALSEHSSGHLSDEQLREDLQALLDKASPLDVEGVDLGLSAEEIVSAIRETRARSGN